MTIVSAYSSCPTWGADYECCPYECNCGGDPVVCETCYETHVCGSSGPESFDWSSGDWSGASQEDIIAHISEIPDLGSCGGACPMDVIVGAIVEMTGLPADTLNIGSGSGISFSGTTMTNSNSDPAVSLDLSQFTDLDGSISALSSGGFEITVNSGTVSNSYGTFTSESGGTVTFNGDGTFTFGPGMLWESPSGDVVILTGEEGSGVYDPKENIYSGIDTSILNINSDGDYTYVYVGEQTDVYIGQNLPEGADGVAMNGPAVNGFGVEMRNVANVYALMRDTVINADIVVGDFSYSGKTAEGEYIGSAELEGLEFPSYIEISNNFDSKVIVEIDEETGEILLTKCNPAGFDCSPDVGGWLSDIIAEAFEEYDTPIKFLGEDGEVLGILLPDGTFLAGGSLNDPDLLQEGCESDADCANKECPGEVAAICAISTEFIDGESVTTGVCVCPQNNTEPEPEPEPEPRVDECSKDEKKCKFYHDSAKIMICYDDPVSHSQQLQWHPDTTCAEFCLQLDGDAECIDSSEPECIGCTYREYTCDNNTKICTYSDHDNSPECCPDQEIIFTIRDSNEEAVAGNLERKEYTINIALLNNAEIQSITKLEIKANGVLIEPGNTVTTITDSFTDETKIVSMENLKINTASGGSVELSQTAGLPPINLCSGIFSSANFLSESVLSIDSFGYTASSTPPGTNLKAQFSQDNIVWKDSSGTTNGWDTLSQGRNAIDLSSLGWSGASFYYRIKFESRGIDIPVLHDIILSIRSHIDELHDPSDELLSIIYMGTITFVKHNCNSPPINHCSSIFSSANFLGKSVLSIDSFGYTASSIPSGTNLKAQFSQDNIVWKDSSGTTNGWDTLSQGRNAIDLSSLGWSGESFYYRIKFESDGTDAPVLHDIILSIHDHIDELHDPSDELLSIIYIGTITFVKHDCIYSGSLTSSNLLSGQSVLSIDSFGYSTSSIPSGTNLNVQFSQDNIVWKDSSGTTDGWNSLSQGTNAIDLSSLGWSGVAFYYRMKFESNGTDTPVLDEISIATTRGQTSINLENENNNYFGQLDLSDLDKETKYEISFDISLVDGNGATIEYQESRIVEKLPSSPVEFSIETLDKTPVIGNLQRDQYLLDIALDNTIINLITKFSITANEETLPPDETVFETSDGGYSYKALLNLLDLDEDMEYELFFDMALEDESGDYFEYQESRKVKKIMPPSTEIMFTISRKDGELVDADLEREEYIINIAVSDSIGIKSITRLNIKVNGLELPLDETALETRDGGYNYFGLLDLTELNIDTEYEIIFEISLEDEYNKYHEHQESRNMKIIRYVEIPIIDIKVSGIDLQLLDFHNEDSNIEIGSNMQFYYKIKNNGYDPSGEYDIRIYLSEGDKSISADDTLLETIIADNLEGSSETEPQTVSLAIPSNLQADNLYCFIMVIDEENQISETNKNNNALYVYGAAK